MEGTENLEAMFREMKCLMELEGEYLSHQTALFLLGQSQALLVFYSQLLKTLIS